MPQTLANITGIAFISFLWILVGTQIKRTWFKLVIFVMALIFLLYIPGEINQGSRDCSVLANGSYVCFMTNGSQVTNYTNYVNTGEQITPAYIYALMIFMLCVMFIGIETLASNGDWMNKIKRWLGKFMRK